MSLHFTVYDIETEPFSEHFRNAESRNERLKHAPKPRVMVVYSSLTDEYYPYTIDNIGKAVERLLESDLVVSFNGANFDELVLIKNRFIDQTITESGTNTLDLLEKLNEKHGYRASLDALVKLNFNEKKHTSGRKMSNLEEDKLMQACKSDVSQTKRLYELYIENVDSIKYPSSYQNRYLLDQTGVFPFSHIHSG